MRSDSYILIDQWNEHHHPIASLMPTWVDVHVGWVKAGVFILSGEETNDCYQIAAGTSKVHQCLLIFANSRQSLVIEAFTNDREGDGISARWCHVHQHQLAWRHTE
jgi:hypothetical protein